MNFNKNFKQIYFFISLFASSLLCMELEQSESLGKKSYNLLVQSIQENPTEITNTAFKDVWKSLATRAYDANEFLCKHDPHCHCIYLPQPTRIHDGTSYYFENVTSDLIQGDDNNFVIEIIENEMRTWRPWLEQYAAEELPSIPGQTSSITHLQVINHKLQHFDLPYILKTIPQLRRFEINAATLDLNEIIGTEKPLEIIVRNVETVKQKIEDINLLAQGLHLYLPNCTADQNSKNFIKEKVKERNSLILKKYRIKPGTQQFIFMNAPLVAMGICCAALSFLGSKNQSFSQFLVITLGLTTNILGKNMLKKYSSSLIPDPAIYVSFGEPEDY
jgi:hypothetical protein